MAMRSVQPKVECLQRQTDFTQRPDSSQHREEDSSIMVYDEEAVGLRSSVCIP